MNAQFTTYKSMDDLVFENRNIGYGAYILRKEYNTRLFTAVIISLGVVTLALFGPQFFREEKVIKKDVKSDPTTILDVEPLILLPPNQPVKASRPPSAPRADIIPLVTDTQTEPDLFTNANLEEPDITFDGPGDITGDYDPTPFTNLGAATGTSVVKVDTFLRVEVMPEFNGDLSKFFSKHLRFPKAAIDQGLDGKVYLSFVIGTDGSIGDIQVLKGISKELDEEAIRVVRKMPNWKPGRQSGRDVPVRFSLPVTYKLQN